MTIQEMIVLLEQIPDKSQECKLFIFANGEASELTADTKPVE
jgi:hypothetical protein